LNKWLKRFSEPVAKPGLDQEVENGRLKREHRLIKESVDAYG
jgi:hypothetical protein